jgi:hypothetical protein
VVAAAVERDHDRPRLARAERDRDHAEAGQLGVGARVTRRVGGWIGEIELPREARQRRGRSRRGRSRRGRSRRVITCVTCVA